MATINGDVDDFIVGKMALVCAAWTLNTFEQNENKEIIFQMQINAWDALIVHSRTGKLYYVFISFPFFTSNFVQKTLNSVGGDE